MTFKIAMIGVGKLGLPVAVCLASKFEVVGYDLDVEKLRLRPYEHREKGPQGEEDFQKCFEGSVRSGRLKFCPDMRETIRDAGVVFVAVQTPHEAQFGGSVCVPRWARKDFNYSYLKRACEDLSYHIGQSQTVAVISTALPGTMRREIVPILGGKCRLLYNPHFIAMGSVLQDYLHPEFTLIGTPDGSTCDSGALTSLYEEFYGRATSEVMSYESAELVKTGYNCAITLKITLANTLCEVAHKTPGCCADDVTRTLGKATDRLVSARYTAAGLADGGSCHPRDLIAMSYLGRQLDLSFNLFEQLTQAREKQSAWLAGLLMKHGAGLPKAILGKSFKPETEIVAGSPSLLIADILKGVGEEFSHWDPYVDGTEFPFGGEAHAFLIGTKHECFRRLPYPRGSTVIDPHRYVPPSEGVEVIPVGVGV